MAELVFQERWEVVLDEIRRRIMAGELPPGTALPETELAAEFGVSRGPIRTALRALEVAGLVISRSRRPAIVAPTTISDVEELFSVRATLDTFAVDRAVSRHPSEFASGLRDQHEQLSGSIAANSGFEQLVHEDVSFHDRFYEWADNRKLAGIWSTLRDPVIRMMNLSIHLQPPHWELVEQEHLEIVAAAERRDRKAAVRAARQHLVNAEERAAGYVRAHLEAKESGGL